MQSLQTPPPRNAEAADALIRAHRQGRPADGPNSRTRSFDSTLALLREGYNFIANRCARYGSDAFETRLMLLLSPASWAKTPPECSTGRVVSPGAARFHSQRCEQNTGLHHRYPLAKSLRLPHSADASALHARASGTAVMISRGSYGDAVRVTGRCPRESRSIARMPAVYVPEAPLWGLPDRRAYRSDAAHRVNTIECQPLARLFGRLRLLLLHHFHAVLAHLRGRYRCHNRMRARA